MRRFAMLLESEIFLAFHTKQNIGSSQQTRFHKSLFSRQLSASFALK
jgi:hypothetical protein